MWVSGAEHLGKQMANARCPMNKPHNRERNRRSGREQFDQAAAKGTQEAVSYRLSIVYTVGSSSLGLEAGNIPNLEMPGYLLHAKQMLQH